MDNAGMDALDAARAFVDERFAEAPAAFVAGSVFRGDATPTSDLDIVVVTDREDAPYRASFREHGWPIEVFVHTEESLRRYFASDIQRRRPSLVTMCVEGTIVRDRGALAQRIRQEAEALLRAGPEPLEGDDLLTHRYSVTDLLDDFVGCDRPAEGIFIATELAQAAADLILAYRGMWSGEGKWVPRALYRLDPELAEEMTEGLAEYCDSGNKEPLIRFAEKALRPVGGRLFDGYYSAGK